MAKRLDFDRAEALSLGKARAGLNAQSKGRRLGLCKPRPEDIGRVRARQRGEEFWVETVAELDALVPAILDRAFKEES